MKKLKNDCESAQKCQNVSSFMERYFNEPVAMFFSRFFLKIKLHPNWITIISVICGVIGGLMFYHKNIWFTVGAIAMILLSIIFDTCDGQVARLGTKRSKYGRLIDGLGDGIVYAAIYVGVSLHLMTEYIPFTDVMWGWWIWIPAVIVGVFLHGAQARMADYFLVLHIFFAKSKTGEFARAKNLKVAYEQAPTKLDKFCNKSYYSYTKAQEKWTPNTQKLLDEIEKSDTINEQAREQFLQKSNVLVKFAPLLTVNFRSVALFILAIHNIHFLIFPFVMFILEPIKYILIHKYEKLAKSVYDNHYANQQTENAEVA